MQQMSEDTEAVHALLAQRMEAQQNPETAEWFNRYLKGAIRYRGLKTHLAVFWTMCLTPPPPIHGL